MPGALRGVHTVERGLSPGCLHLAVTVGVGGQQEKISQFRLCGEFETLCNNSLSILTLAQIGTDRDIGNGVVQPIVKGCCANGHVLGREQIEETTEHTSELQSLMRISYAL